MAKPSLSAPLDQLEKDMIETLRAGLHQWRSDLQYPASYSDWQACVRGLLVMFKVERKPLPEPLASPCPMCDGLGYTITRASDGYKETKGCAKCNRTGKVYY